MAIFGFGGLICPRVSIVKVLSQLIMTVQSVSIHYTLAQLSLSEQQHLSLIVPINRHWSKLEVA